MARLKAPGRLLRPVSAKVRPGRGVRAERETVKAEGPETRHCLIKGGEGSKLVVLVLIADEVELARLDLAGHAPMLERFLAAVGDPHFASARSSAIVPVSSSQSAWSETISGSSTMRWRARWRTASSPRPSR